MKCGKKTRWRGGMLSPGVEQGLAVSLAGGQASWAARVQPFFKVVKRNVEILSFIIRYGCFSIRYCNPTVIKL
jgi:hypothetical protein